MVNKLPEFKSTLNSVARLGRAMGVHLILAAQHPEGVVSEQIRSNMKFRICLRVESPAASREMLRRPDAAYLPGDIPGRAYLQIGERMELFQVAYASADYDARPSAQLPAIRFLSHHPANMKQDQFALELLRNVVIFGASGWGKTVFLRTLIVSMAAAYAPVELHFYLLEFGGRDLEVFRALPHVGDIILPAQGERVRRLLRKLGNVMEERKNRLSQARAANIYTYNMVVGIRWTRFPMWSPPRGSRIG